MEKDFPSEINVLECSSVKAEVDRLEGNVVVQGIRCVAADVPQPPACTKLSIMRTSPGESVSASGSRAFRSPIAWSRAEQVFVVALGTEYPAPKMFDGCDNYFSVKDEVIDIAPWWNSDAMEHGGTSNCSYCGGVLPIGFPVKSLRSQNWHNWFSFLNSALMLGSGRSFLRLRSDFARKARAGLDPLFCCPDSWDL